MASGNLNHPEIAKSQIELVDALKQMKEWVDLEAQRDKGRTQDSPAKPAKPDSC